MEARLQRVAPAETSGVIEGIDFFVRRFGHVAVFKEKLQV